MLVEYLHMLPWIPYMAFAPALTAPEQIAVGFVVLQIGYTIFEKRTWE
jgi:hypothetical protein